jgi:hypothetical protein
MTKYHASCGCEDRSYEHEKKHCDSKVVFSCGNGMGGNVPVYGEAVAWQPGLVVGTVTLNTGGLESPSVKIDFSSVVNFKTLGLLFEISIRFQLSRSCNNGHKVPLATWTYERELDSNISDTGAAVEAINLYYVEFKDPIAFTWCDCHDCPGCCTYFVEIVDVETDDIDYALITNVGINALAVSS